MSTRKPTFNEACEELNAAFRQIGRALYNGLPGPVKRLLHWANTPRKQFICWAILTGTLALTVALSITMR